MLPPKGAGSCRHLWGLGLTEGRSFLFVLWVMVSLGAELPAMLHQGGMGLKLTLQEPSPLRGDHMEIPEPPFRRSGYARPRRWLQVVTSTKQETRPGGEEMGQESMRAHCNLRRRPLLLWLQRPRTQLGWGPDRWAFCGHQSRDTLCPEAPPQTELAEPAHDRT